MASPAAQEFHRQKMAAERHSVSLRIANGLKSDNPRQIGYRRQHRSFNGIATNPSTAGANLFFVNADETHKPFSTMRGGVIRDFRSAKQLLAQRATSSANIDLEKAGQEPIPSPTLALTDVESRTLELNNLLQSLQDAVDAGEVNSAMIPDLKNILRLFVALLPTFTEGEIADFQQFFNDQIQVLDTKYEEETLSASESQVRNFLRKLHSVIRRFAPDVNRPANEKAIRARDIIQQVFKLEFGKLQAEPLEEEEAEPAPEEAGAAARAEVEEVDEEGPVAGPPADIVEAFGLAVNAPANRGRLGAVYGELNTLFTQITEQLKRDKNKAGMVALYRAVRSRPVKGIADEEITKIKQRTLSGYREKGPVERFRILNRVAPEVAVAFYDRAFVE